MESRVKRTLVKSAPELWELADDLERMEAWMGGVVGSTDRVPVEVTERDPERVLAWRSAPPARFGAQIAIELAEKGFGTSVSITARGIGDADAALERLLDELGAPERRPFAG